MASSVSSERAFSSAGITVSKRRNRLKPDIIEALQVLKCMYHRDLLFREEPSTALEVDDDCEEVQQDDTGKSGWDSLIDDLADDEGFMDHEEDDIFVQDIV